MAKKANTTKQPAAKKSGAPAAEEQATSTAVTVRAISKLNHHTSLLGTIADAIAQFLDEAVGDPGNAAAIGAARRSIKSTADRLLNLSK